MADVPVPALYLTHGQLCTSRSGSERDSDSPTVFPSSSGSWKRVSTTTTKMTISSRTGKDHLPNGAPPPPPSEYPESRGSGYPTGGIDPESHLACQALLRMGFSPGVVKKAADELRKQGQTLTANSLLDAIMGDTSLLNSDQNATESYSLSYDEPDCATSQSRPLCNDETTAPPEEIHSPDGVTGAVVQSAPPSASPTSGEKQNVLGDIKAENERLKEASRCKVCLDADFDTVFLPCCHLVCCHACAKCVKECPICRQKIVRTVKAFTP